uniref:EamA domain-containing protein n=1 Tax=viral metagenome TaxID=1070528 RepID=A0A6C0AJH8_9ZZZZ
MNLLVFFFAFVMTVVDVVMVVLIKEVGTGRLRSDLGLPIASLIYAVEPLIFFQTTQVAKTGIAVTSLAWSVVNSIAVVLVGVLYYRESFNDKRILSLFLNVVAAGVLATSSDSDRTD